MQRAVVNWASNERCTAQDFYMHVAFLSHPTTLNPAALLAAPAPSLPPLYTSPLMHSTPHCTPPSVDFHLCMTAFLFGTFASDQRLGR